MAHGACVMTVQGIVSGTIDRPISYIQCLKKTGPLQLISHNFTHSQSSLIIFGTKIPLTVVKKLIGLEPAVWLT